MSLLSKTMQDVPSKSSSFRDRVKEKLLTPSGTIRLPRFLTNEPAAPARYPGKRLSSTPRKEPISPVEREQWYVPPEPPTPNETTRRKSKASRARNSAPVASPFSWVEGDDYFQQDVAVIDLPRASSSPEANYAVAPTPPIQAFPSMRNTNSSNLCIYDLRQERRFVSPDSELFSGKLYDLIQTIPSVWLASPKIKEAFIPLLRVDQMTTKDRPPEPRELRLIEGFLNHLPDVHIIPETQISRNPYHSTHIDYKRYLNLSVDLADELEKTNSKTLPTYSLLIIATILNEISLWILQQLLHSDTLPPLASPPSPLVVQHSIFGGILMLETHPDEELELAFLDSEGAAWEITPGWLLFKVSEGPDGMPFIPETRFQRRRCGFMRRIGGVGGGLESFN